MAEVIIEPACLRRMSSSFIAAAEVIDDILFSWFCFVFNLDVNLREIF